MPNDHTKIIRYSRKKKILLSIGLVSVLVFIYFVSQYAFEEYPKLEAKYQYFIATLLNSGIGIALYGIRNLKGLNRVYADSVGLLVLFIMPALASFVFFELPEQ